MEAGVQRVSMLHSPDYQGEPAVALERKPPETPRKRAGRTVDGVADEEEATDDVEEGSARGVLAVKVASLVAREGREAEVLLRRGTLGELLSVCRGRGRRGERVGRDVKEAVSKRSVNCLVYNPPPPLDELAGYAS